MKKKTSPPAVKVAPPPPNAVVAMHNDLISSDLISSFALLDLQEHRLLDFCLAHYDSRESNPDCAFNATVKDLAATFPGMDEKSAYSVVERTIESIGSKPLKLREPSGKGRMVRKLRNWFGGLDYYEGEGRFTFYINPLIEHLLIDLNKGCFTRHRLAFVCRFKSPFTRKLYQLVKRWEAVGKWSDVNLDELRVFLGVAGKYPRWQSFKTQINKALEEINEASDLTVSYQMTRWCRRADRVTFYIEGKKEDHNPVDLVVENPAESLEKALVKAGLRIKTVEQLVDKARAGRLVERILARLPRMIERAGTRPPADRVKYLTGAVNEELRQQPLPFGGNGLAGSKTSLENMCDDSLVQLANCGNKVAEKILKERGGEIE